VYFYSKVTNLTFIFGGNGILKKWQPFKLLNLVQPLGGVGARPCYSPNVSLIRVLLQKIDVNTSINSYLVSKILQNASTEAKISNNHE
jgi:hypothetical protein